MTQEEYNRLGGDFAHCPGKNCEKAEECLHHVAHKMLEMNTNASYSVTNPAVITGAQPCPLFTPNRRIAYAWGISHIYDNVRAADYQTIKLGVMQCFGSATYYHIKQQRRAMSEEEQQAVRRVFTENGYDGSAIEFDRYEESYPTLMRMARYR